MSAHWEQIHVTSAMLTAQTQKEPILAHVTLAILEMENYAVCQCSIIITLTVQYLLP